MEGLPTCYRRYSMVTEEIDTKGILILASETVSFHFMAAYAGLRKELRRTTLKWSL